jgi:hypothetical protein
VDKRKDLRDQGEIYECGQIDNDPAPESSPRRNRRRRVSFSASGASLTRPGRATNADALPWRDLTKTYLAKMRFHSIAGWLPPDEAGRLRAAFAREMARLNGG